MQEKLKILTISEPASRKLIDKTLESIGISCEVSHRKSLKDFLNSEESFPDMAIIRLSDKSDGRKVVREVSDLVPPVPVVVLVGEENPAGNTVRKYVSEGALAVISESRQDDIANAIVKISLEKIRKHTYSGTSMGYGLFGSIIDISDSMISVVNDDHKYVFVNDVFARWTGRSKEELIGKKPSELWGEKVFVDKIQNCLESALNGDLIREKGCFDIGNNNDRCYEVIYKPLPDNDYKGSYCLVETRDVTEIEAIRHNASVVERKSNYLEKFLPIGVFECTLDGILTDTNETFRTIMEIKKGDKINISEFFRDDNRFIDFLKMANVGETGSFTQMAMVTGSGKNIYARISCFTRKNFNDSLVVNSTIEDITREVVMERKLVVANKMETLGTLAGGIAHDFNTILTTISGYSELTLQEVSKDEPAYDYLQKLNSAVAKAGSIIKQMLTFSKQISHERIHISIYEVLKESVNFIRTALPFNVYLEEKIYESQGYMMGDPTQLFRVFLNISTNAMQAMEEDGGILKIELTESEDENGSVVSVVFSDTGPGIDKSIIDRIFEPFFTTKETGKGSGMGLSVAHGIVTELGGEITAESEAGKGAVFTIRFPVFRKTEEDSSDKEAFGKRIMYADTNIYFSRTIQIGLESMGYCVTLATNLNDLNMKLVKAGDNKGFLFIREGFGGSDDEEILEKLISDLPEGNMILIQKTESGISPEFLDRHKNDFVVLSDPVTLRDMLNAINDNI